MRWIEKIARIGMKEIVRRVDDQVRWNSPRMRETDSVDDSAVAWIVV